MARIIVIAIKGAPGDCISITPSLLGNMIGDGAVREALRLLRVLYIHGILDNGQTSPFMAGLPHYVGIRQ